MSAKLRKETEVRVKPQQKIPWVHTKLTHYIADKTLNATWHAVSAANAEWETFLSYVIPVGMTAKINETPVMRFKLYDATGTEQYVSADLMLAMSKVGKFLVNEICSLGFYGSRWYDVPWKDQLTKQYRELLEINHGYTQVLLFAGESLLFQVKNSGVDIPAVCHASTLLEFDIDVITDADLKRAMTPTMPGVSKDEIQRQQQIQEVPLSEQTTPYD